MLITLNNMIPITKNCLFFPQTIFYFILLRFISALFIIPASHQQQKISSSSFIHPIKIYSLNQSPHLINRHTHQQHPCNYPYPIMQQIIINPLKSIQKSPKNEKKMRFFFYGIEDYQLILLKAYIVKEFK
jgi:hypothetical protein